LAVAALAVSAAVAAAGPSSSSAHMAHCSPQQVQYGGCGTEVLPAICIAEYSAFRGSWDLRRFIVPDTPDSPYRPGLDPFASATGTAVFRADGSFSIVCRRDGFVHDWPHPVKAWGLLCSILRGGQDLSPTHHGSKNYVGQGYLRLSGSFAFGPDGRQDVHVAMGCAGHFDQTFP
jgi:hypothetical protein